MRIGLVSYAFKNKDIAFNIGEIEKVLSETTGRVDLLCFGEAFLQGFDALCWDYDIDKICKTSAFVSNKHAYDKPC